MQNYEKCLPYFRRSHDSHWFDNAKYDCSAFRSWRLEAKREADNVRFDFCGGRVLVSCSGTNGSNPKDILTQK